MKKKLIMLGTIGIIATILVVGLTAPLNGINVKEINDSEISRFVGLWHPDIGTIESMYHFKSNGTFSSTFGARPPGDIDPFSYGKFELKNGKIFLKYDAKDEIIVWNYTFSNNDSKLTFSFPSNPEVNWSYITFRDHT